MPFYLRWQWDGDYTRTVTESTAGDRYEENRKAYQKCPVTSVYVYVIDDNWGSWRVVLLQRGGFQQLILMGARKNEEQGKKKENRIEP